MNAHDNLIYLQHILDAIDRIEQYLRKIKKEKFLKSPLIQDGVIRQIEIIGEASKHLSNNLRLEYFHIPWDDIAGMRDKLIHHYFGIDISVVWITVKKDLPQLKKGIQEILKK